MDNFKKLDSILKLEASQEKSVSGFDVFAYAEYVSKLENVIAVVSDLQLNTSRIFAGDFAKVIGLTDYKNENSIWEKRLLDLMTEPDREEKFIAELRFFHFLRTVPKSKKNYYLMSKLRFKVSATNSFDVLHRMYYVYDEEGKKVRYAVCLYGPMFCDFKGKSIMVNSLTGSSHELIGSGKKILSNREIEVISYINQGLRTSDIAEKLHVSPYTVSRHRQEIIKKLQVKNSIEACRIAKSLDLI